MKSLCVIPVKGKGLQNNYLRFTKPDYFGGGSFHVFNFSLIGPNSVRLVISFVPNCTTKSSWFSIALGIVINWFQIVPLEPTKTQHT